VLTCTAYNRQHLIEAAGVAREKIHVLYHGLRIPAPAGERATSEPRPLEILTVGRWSEKKGFLDLVEALAVVRDEGVPFRLHIIAGDGSPAYERRVREAITARKLDDRVRISDWLPSEGVEAAMRASDLFVLPCVRPANGAMDGIPNVLIEALSVGLPVVATRLSGIPELIRDGETGRLVHERDPQGLAATLLWCATHRADMARFAGEGRRLVERAFDISQTISTLERHFDAAIAAGCAQPDTADSWSGAADARRLQWNAQRQAHR
jgi:glycosyltransferase involved in cell wall biosynthesis